MIKFFAAIMVICCLCAAEGVEFAKIRNCVITIPDKASNIEKSAANELKLHLSKSYSTAVKLNGKTPEKITFFIGDSKESRAAGFAPVQNKAEFGIVLKGNNFFFTGNDTPGGTVSRLLHDCGTFHSVAYFVQKYMQVNFFLPGKDGTSYAKDPEIRFTADRDFPRSAYAMRGFQTAGKGISRGEMTLFFRRRLGRFPFWSRSNYSYYFLNKWNKRFKHKPEFFALHDGRRVNEKYPRHFPCTSNPEVLEQVIKDITAMVKKRPAIRSIRLFCDAPISGCECSNCRNSAAGKLIKGRDHSEMVYSFFSKIAKGVQKYRKDLYFHTQTKGTVYYRVPETETLPPNTVISILCGHFNAPDYAKIIDLCNQWRKAGATPILYAYPRPPAMKTFPIINPHRIADHFKKFRGVAAGSGISEGRAKVPYTFSALNNFVHSAVMFDTEVDVDKLIDSFCRFVAPKSAGELKDFYSVMEQRLEGAKFWDDPRYNCYSIERLEKPSLILQKVLAKDPGNKFLKQLSADFAEFTSMVRKASADIAHYKKLLAEHKKALPNLKLVKLGTGTKSFFFVPFKGGENFQETKLSVSRSGNTLKLSVTCRENQMSKLRVRCLKNHEGNIWGDDVIELFFGNPGSKFPYIHLAVNPSGVYRAQLNSDSGKKELFWGKGNIKAFRGSDQWHLEITLPMKNLTPVIHNGRIKFGAFRHRENLRQFSGILNSNGNFHDFSGWITLQF